MQWYFLGVITGVLQQQQLLLQLQLHGITGWLCMGFIGDVSGCFITAIGAIGAIGVIGVTGATGVIGVIGAIEAMEDRGVDGEVLEQ